MRPAPRSSTRVGVVGRPARAWAPRGLLVAAASASLGCIIPDAGIVVEDEFRNAGEIRLVEPTPVTQRADEACGKLVGLQKCPSLPVTLPSGLVRSDVPLCVCPSGHDVGLGAFDVLVEDPDVDEEGNPRDDLFGALFLDLPEGAEDPRPYLAYTALLPPDEPARRYRGTDLPTIERPDPHLKAWTLDTTSRVDLCNDNDGNAVSPGLHELRIIVTDRPWYRRPAVGLDGELLLDEQGDPISENFVGIPDLPGGATYDSASYVFQCFDANDPPAGIQCSCEIQGT